MLQHQWGMEHLEKWNSKRTISYLEILSLNKMSSLNMSLQAKLHLGFVSLSYLSSFSYCKLPPMRYSADCICSSLVSLHVWQDRRAYPKSILLERWLLLTYTQSRFIEWFGLEILSYHFTPYKEFLSSFLELNRPS